ncbi:hypothetical protein [Veillonella caviae]|uniref:hypothetical protein n=1 Tax=Veillonella caviae TaxID=248316 RepID=UPI0013DFEAD5|nr:hypothetical protein [Veillonella caviae]
MVLKIIAFLLMIGTMGALEIDRIEMMQAIIQFILAGAVFIISEQADRIKSLKRRLGHD